MPVNPGILTINGSVATGRDIPCARQALDVDRVELKAHCVAGGEYRVERGGGAFGKPVEPTLLWLALRVTSFSHPCIPACPHRRAGHAA